MKEFTITEKDEGIRFNKYLNRLLPNAGSGLLYKMLRKKNITLNAQKAEGSETLHKGDVVSVYFSDETLMKFRGNPDEQAVQDFSKHAVLKKDIVYEDDNLIVAFKPENCYTQNLLEEVCYGLWVNRKELGTQLFCSNT